MASASDHGEGFHPYSFLGPGTSRPPRGTTSDSLGVSIDQESGLGSVGPLGGSLNVGVGGDSLRMPANLLSRTPVARTPGGSIPHESEHAEFLSDKLEYIVPPLINAVERDTPMNSRTVFMGHMRFETTPAEVRWIVRRLCGVTALKVEFRAKGCFLVHLATEQDENVVRELHRRILMDHHGIWVARTQQEASFLNDYVEQVLCRGPKRRLRLPKDCVTVETPHDARHPSHLLAFQQQSHEQNPTPASSGSVRSPTRFSPTNMMRSSASAHQHSITAAPPPPPSYLTMTPASRGLHDGYEQQYDHLSTVVNIPHSGQSSKSPNHNTHQ